MVLSSTPGRGLLGSLKQFNIPFKHGNLDTVSTPSYDRSITFLLGHFPTDFERPGHCGPHPHSQNFQCGLSLFDQVPQPPPLIISNILQHAHITCHVSRSLSPCVLDSCFIIWKFLNHI